MCLKGAFWKYFHKDDIKLEIQIPPPPDSYKEKNSKKIGFENKFCYSVTWLAS